MTKYKSPYRRRKLANYNYSPRETISQKKVKAYRRIFYVIIAIAVISIFLFINLDKVVEQLTGFDENSSPESTTEATITQTEENLLWTPKIDPLPSVTNQKKINVVGNAFQGVQVELIFNGDSISIDDLDEEKKFEFTDLNLQSGENTVQVRALEKDGEKSELSDEVTVILDLKPPTLEITAPISDEEFGGEEQKISVTGSTEADTKVYINDHIVIVKADNTFTYQVTLKDGENTIIIKATDEAGNETVQEITVTFNPEMSAEE